MSSNTQNSKQNTNRIVYIVIGTALVLVALASLLILINSYRGDDTSNTTDQNSAPELKTSEETNIPLSETQSDNNTAQNSADTQPASADNPESPENPQIPSIELPTR